MPLCSPDFLSGRRGRSRAVNPTNTNMPIRQKNIGLWRRVLFGTHFFHCVLKVFSVLYRDRHKLPRAEKKAAKKKAREEKEIAACAKKAQEEKTAAKKKAREEKEISAKKAQDKKPAEKTAAKQRTQEEKETAAKKI